MWWTDVEIRLSKNEKVGLDDLVLPIPVILLILVFAAVASKLKLLYFNW